MKYVYKNYFFILIAVTFVFITSCDDQLSETNINPNSLNAEQVDPAYIMTDAISQTARHMALAGFTGNTSLSYLPAAMQYLQEDQGGGVNIKNFFGWKPRGWSYRELYLPLANSNYLGERAQGSKDSTFLRGVSLTMQAYWFGYNTSLWGDVPFSEAYRGQEKILKPVYDSQKDVFKGVLSYLESANEAFAKVNSVSKFTKFSDIMYDGDVKKWQAFANSLRLRFLMRLSEKTVDMQTIGVDVKSEFNKIVSDPNKYPLIVNNEDNAVVQFPATSSDDSWNHGPLNQKNEDPYRRQKPGAPFVNYMKENGDPRLTVWIKPVDVQTFIADMGDEKVIMKDDDGSIKRYLKTMKENVDTSLFVGMPIALPNPDNYNGNNGNDRNTVKALNPSVYSAGASNPFISYFTSMFFSDTNPYLPARFLTATEVNFLLSEAAVRGWISVSAEEYFKKGILTSLREWGVNNGDLRVYNPLTNKIEPYDENKFIGDLTANFNNSTDKILPLMEQKQVALFLTVEFYFDWRRTGYPDLGKNLVNGPQGDKIPVRHAFGDSEKNFNEENVNKAIQNLEPQVDDLWSKMWLIQGTGKPW